ncbi:MAG: hypothetical protein A4E64_02644 [Syntrophorhabdus sp. PtaU1.Bin058]|nr:MAG: hypothetical protein A4E64_02644 [Syntrophorhabdus sp. PtaU1.Bin058]
MEKEKKAGIILIVIGICIPLLSLPFVTGFERHKGFLRNVYETGIPLVDPEKSGAGIRPETERPKSERPKTEGAKDTRSFVERFTPRMLPLRYILALGVFLIFLGILRIDKALNRKGGE